MIILIKMIIWIKKKKRIAFRMKKKNQIVLRIKKKILPGYLFAFLNTKYAQDKIKRFARPTGKYNLNLMEAGKILIPNFQIDELSFFKGKSGY